MSNQLCKAEWLSYLCRLKTVVPPSCYEKFLDLTRDYHCGKISTLQFKYNIHLLSTPYQQIIEKDLIHSTVDYIYQTGHRRKTMKEQPHIKSFIVNGIMKKHLMRNRLIGVLAERSRSQKL